MDDPLEVLASQNVRHYLHSYSALDRYFRVREPGSVYVLAESSLVDIARLFDEVEYSASVAGDASIRNNGTRYVLTCLDDAMPHPGGSFTVLELLYDPARGVFLDPRAVYRDLRKPDLHPGSAGACDRVMRVMDAGRIVSRYHYEASWPSEAGDAAQPGQFPPLSATAQRELLTDILSSRAPDKGLRLLGSSGFIAAYWPELAVLTEVPHTKDFHPEGDAWQHTMETFAHRKTVNLGLSLALLLHDAGKAVAPPSGERRFDAHAEHSARIARRFLQALQFPQSTVEHVVFLVRYHMLPPALKRLPEFRTAPLMDSGWFPDLLELYYADLSSSYRSPEGYYEACRIYRHYLRRRRAPVRPGPMPERKRKSHFR